MKIKFFAFVLASLLALSFPAQAAPEEYAFDLPHTSISFYVNHLGVSYSTGRFTGFDGSFLFDEEKPENSSVDVTIHTNSLEMLDEKWNEHLKGPDFFNVAQFPDMTFKSVKVEKTGEKTAKLTGDLTLLGVTRPVILDVTLNGIAAHPMKGNPIIGFSVTGIIQRSEFGMTYGIPMVGDDVSLRIEVEGFQKTKTNP